MKLKASKELEALHLRAINELAAQELRVFLAWMMDSPEFSAGPIELSKRLSTLDPRDCRRSLKKLVELGFLTQEDRLVNTKYRGVQTVTFYILKSANAGGTTAGGSSASVLPPNPPNLKSNLSNLTTLAAESGEQGVDEFSEDEEQLIMTPEQINYFNRLFNSSKKA